MVTDDTHSECNHERDEEDFSLTLTRNEALYLDDCLTLMVERELTMDNKSILSTLRNVAPVAQLPVPIELIDKVAFAVLYTTDETNPCDEVDIKLDSSELYLLREVAQSYIKIGREPVGFNLKRKIYASLYAAEYEQEKAVDKLLREALSPNTNIELEEIPETDKSQLR
jgi:hypothetical protein|tara:strand:+ start:1842 stop:2348 length:507 start_codon:yes stop_codon:yes gene_type:complete